MPPFNLVLVGCGKMGSALLDSWIKAKVEATFTVINPSPLSSSLPSSVNYLSSVQSAAPLLAKTDIIVLAVKPQIMAKICADLKPFTPETTPILSIAAGKTIQSFERIFGLAQPLIRVMPNTPAAIGKGASVAVANTKISATDKARATRLLECAGTLDWLEDESLLDAVTALSGSGPAYLFYLIEVLSEAGIRNGLPHDLSVKLARQTVIGAAALAEKNPETNAATLRQDVTSPGGTTEAALKVLMNGEILDIFEKALSAAKDRGKALNQ